MLEGGWRMDGPFGSPFLRNGRRCGCMQAEMTTNRCLGHVASGRDDGYYSAPMRRCVDGVGVRTWRWRDGGETARRE